MSCETWAAQRDRHPYGHCTAGDIAWARLKNRAGVWQMDLDAGLAGGGTDPEAVLDAVTVYPGGFVVVLGIHLVEGG